MSMEQAIRNIAARSVHVPNKRAARPLTAKHENIIEKYDE